MGQRRARSCQAAQSRSGDGADLAELSKTGWKPKRTIKFALWDAEEFGLIGSTEWVEKHEAGTEPKSSSRISIAIPTGKSDFSAGGSPSMSRLHAANCT